MLIQSFVIITGMLALMEICIRVRNKRSACTISAIGNANSLSHTVNLLDERVSNTSEKRFRIGKLLNRYMSFLGLDRDSEIETPNLVQANSSGQTISINDCDAANIQSSSSYNSTHTSPEASASHRVIDRYGSQDDSSYDTANMAPVALTISSNSHQEQSLETSRLSVAADYESHMSHYLDDSMSNSVGPQATSRLIKTIHRNSDKCERRCRGRKSKREIYIRDHDKRSHNDCVHALKSVFC